MWDSNITIAQADDEAIGIGTQFGCKGSAKPLVSLLPYISRISYAMVVQS